MYYLIQVAIERSEDGKRRGVIRGQARTLKTARAVAKANGYYGCIGLIHVEPVSRGYDGAPVPCVGARVVQSGSDKGVDGIWLTEAR